MKYSNNSDEDFAGESFYAPLWRTNVMNRVLMVIQDNIPEVKTIIMLKNLLQYVFGDYTQAFYSRW